MRLTLRLTAFLVLMSLASFGGIGWLLIEVERDDLREAVTKETLLLGRALQISMENALRDRQLEDVRETIDKLRGLEPGLVVALLAPDGQPLAPDFVRPADLTTLPVSRSSRVLEFEPPAFPGKLVLVEHLTGDDGQPLGSLLLARPLATLEQDLAETTRNITLSIVTVVLFIGLLAALAGTLFIGRPLTRLMDWMHRIRESGSLLALPAASSALMMPRDEVRTLEREFADMVGSLRDARRRQEELERGLVRIDKLAVVGQLAAGLAHEIGSPLQILCGRAQALADQPLDHLEVRRQATILVGQGERISRIVQKLLSLSRPRGPLKDLNDIVPLVRSVLELLEHQARRASIALELVAPPRLLSVCDRDQVQQVVLNLLTNAMRATPAGGRVTVELKATDDRVHLEVRDSGPGIDLAHKDRLFEAFFTTTAEGEGTGLGLAIVRSILIEHGGTIDASNLETGGACFTVQWPLGQPGGAR